MHFHKSYHFWGFSTETQYWLCSCLTLKFVTGDHPFYKLAPRKLFLLAPKQSRRTAFDDDWQLSIIVASKMLFPRCRVKNCESLTSYLLLPPAHLVFRKVMFPVMSVCQSVQWGVPMWPLGMRSPHNIPPPPHRSIQTSPVGSPSPTTWGPQTTLPTTCTCWNLFTWDPPPLNKLTSSSPYIHWTSTEILSCCLLLLICVGNFLDKI